VTTDKTPPSPQPGPDAEIDDTQTDIEQTRKELSETAEALTGKADVKDEVEQKVADSKDRITEKANETRAGG
jgi:predicted  nucleic acid-binding Zn-ribbon protein